MVDNLLYSRIRESIMSISETSHQAKVTYVTEQTRSQKVAEIKIDDPRHSNRDGLSAGQTTALNFVEFSSNASSTTRVAGDEENPDDTYQRPISPTLLRNKLLLEAIFDIKVQDENEELIQTINRLKLSQSNSSLENISAQRPLSLSDITANQGPITIQEIGNVFASDSEVMIINTITDSQNLNFSTSGIYNINDKVFHSTFELQLSEQRVSMTQSTLSVDQMKDPLLVQFGPRSLGQLNGQSSEIDINSDDVPDSLPMFEGDVGYLVFDKNNNGKADGGHELFGPQSGDGFQDLSALDSNNNGFIDREDDSFSQLKLWQIDGNGNETWRNLSDTDIEAISLNSTVTPFNFYDKDDQLQAQLTQSSVALTDKGVAYGVHQVDVRI